MDTAKDTTTQMATAITNIGSLITNDPSLGQGPSGIIENAAVIIDGDRIVWIGSTSKAPPTDNRTTPRAGRPMPGFVDSHSHLVFAGDRTAEFNARMSGQPLPGRRYPHHRRRHPRRDGRRTRRHIVARHVREALRQGTTTMETKSGYGLTVEDEARSLRIAARPHRRDHLPRRPHRGPPSSPTTRPAMSIW